MSNKTTFGVATQMLSDLLTDHGQKVAAIGLDQEVKVLDVDVQDEVSVIDLEINQKRVAQNEPTVQKEVK